MLPFLTLIPMLQSAVGVVASFTGTAKQAKISTEIQDAVSVISALTPFVQQFASGVEVSEEDVRAALHSKDAALAALDAEIAKHTS